MSLGGDCRAVRTGQRHNRAGGKQIANWTMTAGRGNYPMALDLDARHVIVVFRDPAKLMVLRMGDGGSVAERETCGDADDVFFEARRHRIYVSCGDGFIDIFDVAGAAYRSLARMPTARGARTSRPPRC